MLLHTTTHKLVLKLNHLTAKVGTRYSKSKSKSKSQNKSSERERRLRVREKQEKKSLDTYSPFSEVQSIRGSAPECVCSSCSKRVQET